MVQKKSDTGLHSDSCDCDVHEHEHVDGFLPVTFLEDDIPFSQLIDGEFFVPESANKPGHYEFSDLMIRLDSLTGMRVYSKQLASIHQETRVWKVEVGFFTVLSDLSDDSDWDTDDIDADGLEKYKEE